MILVLRLNCEIRPITSNFMTLVLGVPLLNNGVASALM